MEEYKIIKNYSNYEVSTFGNIRNITTRNILKGRLRGKGYYAVALFNENGRKDVSIHRIVADTFIENENNKEQVDHRDGNKLNNRVENLRWIQNNENQRNRNISKNNTTGVKGVCYDKKNKSFNANITLDGLKIHIGCFKTLEEAKHARISKAKLLFGEYIHSSELV